MLLRSAGCTHAQCGISEIDHTYSCVMRYNHRAEFHNFKEILPYPMPSTIPSPPSSLTLALDPKDSEYGDTAATQVACGEW